MNSMSNVAMTFSSGITILIYLKYFFIESDGTEVFYLIVHVEDYGV